MIFREMEDSKIRKDIQHQDMNSNVRYFLKYFVVCIIGKIFIFVNICILGKILKILSCKRTLQPAIFLKIKLFNFADLPILHAYTIST